MIKKIFVILSLSTFIINLSFATDLLAFYTNSKLTENSPGVKVLSLEEKKNVRGEYNVVYGITSDYTLGTNRVTEAMAIAVPTTFELLTKGICDIGVQTQCFIPGSYEAYGHYEHYTTSKNRYKELMFYTDNDPINKFLAFTLKRTISFSNRYKPAVYYTTGASVIGINGGAIYKIKSNLPNTLITRELSNRYKQQLKQMLGL